MKTATRARRAAFAWDVLGAAIVVGDGRSRIDAWHFVDRRQDGLHSDWVADDGFPTGDLP